MENPAYGKGAFDLADGFRQLFFGVGANPDEILGTKKFDHVPEVEQACLPDRGHGVGRNLVGGKVGPGILHPDERAIIGHKMMCKKVLRRWKPFSKKAPEAAAADFGALAVESGNWTFRMFRIGLVHRSRDPHPVPHRGDLSEGDPCLGHSKWARVHAQKKDPDGAAPKTREVVTVPLPCILQGIVGICDRLLKRQGTEGPSQLVRGIDETGHGRDLGEADEYVERRSRLRIVGGLSWYGGGIRASGGCKGPLPSLTLMPLQLMKIEEYPLRRWIHAFCGMLLFLSPAMGAEKGLWMPNIFGDQMVLQRDQPIRLWGRAEAGKPVAATLGGHTATTISEADGRWSLVFDSMKANAVGQTLIVKSEADVIRLDNVLIGDVWLCGGQSNMEWRLRSVRDADMEIPSANYPGIRFIRIKPEGSPEAREDFPAEKNDGTWLSCSPETIGDCSGVAYFFGSRLHRRLNVPVGLISAAWGGTMAQHWVTRKTLETIPAARPYLRKYDDECRAWLDGGGEQGAKARFAADQRKWEALAKTAREKGEKEPGGKPNLRNYGDPSLRGRIPAGPLNAMIMPMAGLSIRGVLFYQGENNSFGDSWIPFLETFPAVISDWRKIFRNSELPFGIIQIAGWSTRRSMTYDMNHHTNVVREVQFNTWRATPGTGLIVSFDANSNSSIHPARKYPVGDRAARWALSEVHGVADPFRKGPLEWHGPVYESMERVGEKIRVQFEVRGAQGLRINKADARGFYVAGEDRIFHHAQARVTGGRDNPPAVEVWSEEVAEPVAVRYAWSNLPLGTLMNGRELPAFPFRTDSWPLKPHYGEALYHVSGTEEK